VCENKQKRSEVNERATSGFSCARQELIMANEDDDDIPQLSAHTLAALSEFYSEHSNDDKIGEDWQVGVGVGVFIIITIYNPVKSILVRRCNSESLIRRVYSNNE
jgi:hypothetical protein